MRPTAPFDLQRWIDAHRHELKPPVSNRQIFPAGDFIVMAVGGPNARKDYHVDPGEEFFYQLEGTLTLKTMQDGGPVDYRVRGGEVFLLPAFVPHSPQREAGSIGLVVERRRLPGEQDGFQWYCEHCHALLYEEHFVLENIETQFPPVFERFYAHATKRTCGRCGTVMERP
ncbi:MAG: 3-hydroxyanthranilate 3,4-dioxygenase [Steroidobacteraceae bacterium]|jgi:3-hydroxyanthranilate 3,4-dioxygenase|nr:3-hydroxyanthranilate 3,4-dioxygenase [Steroidobacteraceae bacterium]